MTDAYTLCKWSCDTYIKQKYGDGTQELGKWSFFQFVKKSITFTMKFHVLFFTNAQILTNFYFHAEDIKKRRQPVAKTINSKLCLDLYQRF